MIFIARNWLTWCGSCLGKSEICRAGCQEGQAGAEDAVHSWNYFSSFLFFFCKASVFILRPFNLLNQAHSDDLDNLPHLMSAYFRL